MKSLFLLLLPIFLFWGNPFAEAQKDTKVQKALAIKIKKEILPQFFKNPELGVYTIDKEGVLRPTSKYKILLDLTNRGVQIIPSERDYFVGRVEEIELPSGDKVVCYCNTGNDDCKFVPSENHREFKCSGSCGCGIGVIFNFNDFIEYQNPEGNWHNLGDARY